MPRSEEEKKAMTRLADFINKELNWQQKLEYCARVTPELMGDKFIDHWELKLKIAKEVKRELG